MTRSLFQRLASDRSGSILMLFGLSILFLVGTAGAGYDLGHQQLVRQKIQQASDAATLAAASLPLGTSDAARIATANQFFQLNYPDSFLGVERPTPTVTIGGNSVSVTASTDVPTSFVANFGVSTLAAHGTTTAQFKKGYSKVDLILVMDNSASMGREDVQATTDSIVSSIWDGYALPNCISWHQKYYPSLTLQQDTDGCNGELAYTNDSDGTPYSKLGGPSRLDSLHFNAQYAAVKLIYTQGVTGNQVAAVTFNDTLVSSYDFTDDWTHIAALLDSMWPEAQTNSTIGLQKAMDIGTAGFRAGTLHVVILFTDGGNNNNISPGDAQIDASSLAICQQFKDQGTLVYTIGLGSEVTSPAHPLIEPFLSNCAWGPNGPPDANGIYPNQNSFFFAAATADDLNKAFTNIVGQLQKLVITQ